MKFFSVTIILSLILISSCGSKQERSAEFLKMQKDSIDKAKMDSIESNQENLGSALSTTRNEDYSNKEDTVADLHFPEFQLSINRLSVHDEKHMLDNFLPDTVYINAELGETIEGQAIEIYAKKIYDLKVEQQYETSVTVMNDGAHCDLYEWEHYNSDWKELKATASGKFTGLKYSASERYKFPETDMNKLKEFVKEHCGKIYTDIVAKCTSVHKSPLLSEISRYFLRISGKDMKTDKKFSKLIVIKTPMGC